MRRAIFPLILTVLLMTEAILSGCSGGLKFGNIFTEKVVASDFSNVDIDGPFEVTITKSDAFSVTISVEANFRDYVSAVKEGDTLKINLNPRHPFTNFPVGAKTFKAKITMPVLSQLRLSGATKGTISGFKLSQDFKLDVSGASSLDMKNIEAGDVELQVTGASRITGDLKANGIKAELSGASKMELEGSAESILLTASGASNINLLNLPLNSANIKLSGASEATINVKTKLDAVLTDAARLNFYGNPSIGDISVSGASTIKHK